MSTRFLSLLKFLARAASIAFGYQSDTRDYPRNSLAGRAPTDCSLEDPASPSSPRRGSLGDIRQTSRRHAPSRGLTRPLSDARNDARDYDSRPTLDQRLEAAVNRTVKRQVQRVVWASLATVGRLSRLLASIGRRPGAPLRAGDRRIKRILVVRTDLIGDLVFTLPAIRALRQGYPDASIDALVLPSTRDILVGNPDIAHIHIYDPNIWRHPTSLLNPRNWQRVGALISGLRAQRYDLGVSIAGDWGSVLTWVSGARRRVGYSGEAYPGLMTDPVPGRRYATRQHELAYVVRLARAAGGVLAGADATPVLHVQPEAAQRVRGLIAASLPASLAGVPDGALDGAPDGALAGVPDGALAGVPDGALAGVPDGALDGAQDGRAAPLVVLHAGAQNGRAKRWVTASWAILADRLFAELGARVFFTGAAADAPLVAAILRHMRHARTATDLSGRTSLADLVALLDQCDLLVSGDSGPLHIACAVGTPVVGLYGPTDPALSGPVSEDAVVLRQELWCAPCYDASAAADCRFGNPVCMKALTPARVFAAARGQLARHGAVSAPLPLAVDEEIVQPSNAPAPDTTPALRRRLP